MEKVNIDLTDRQYQFILRLLKKYLPSTTTWAYGSRTNGTARAESDLDMVVFSTPDQTLAVANLIEAFAESDLPFRVDLFVWDEIPESFQRTVKMRHIALC